MKVGVVAESRSGERRVALVPEHVQRLVADGHQVLVQSGAGAGARADDEAYAAAGAQVADESDSWPPTSSCTSPLWTLLGSHACALTL